MGVGASAHTAPASLSVKYTVPSRPTRRSLKRWEAPSSGEGRRALTTGPRGGGRSLEAIVSHVIEADASYLGAVGWKAPKDAEPRERLTASREAILAALQASASGEIPSKGPRGGARWTARYFVRRVAWHVIAHMWEIERRA